MCDGHLPRAQFITHHLSICLLPIHAPISLHIPGGVGFGVTYGGIVTCGGMYPNSLLTALIKGYFPWPHILPLKSSRSKLQNEAAPRPFAKRTTRQESHQMN